MRIGKLMHQEQIINLLIFSLLLQITTSLLQKIYDLK